jgi:2'-5' RNA ligase
MLRTFLAVEASPEIRALAARLIGRLHRGARGIRWVEPHNLHWTIKFLGDVAPDDVRRVCEAAARAAGDASPFEVVCRGVGAFPSIDRPRTIWLGLAAGGEGLAALAECVESQLEPLGYRREARRFHPHLTLGRVRESGRDRTLIEALQAHRDFAAGSMEVDELVVFHSLLGKQGPTYEPLATAELGGLDTRTDLGE